MSEAAAPRGTFTPNFNLNLPDIAGDWDLWGALTNDNWTFIDGALLPIWGGVMTGLLTLFGDPVAPLGAATKRYVDAVSANQANYLPLAGGTMTGPLQVPQGSNGAASVQLGQPNNGLFAPANGNVGITAAGTTIFSTSSITARFNIPLQVNADPTANLGVATKQYVDAVSAQLPNYLARSGGQMTGPLITMAGTGGSNLGIGIGNNTTGLWSSAGNALVLQTGGATNLYLSPAGNQMAQSLTMMPGATLTLSADAAQPMQAVTLQQMGAILGGPYLPISGGVLTGALTLAGDPTAALHAATRQYADTKLPLAGGVLTGALTLAGDPTVALGAATRQYADTKLPLAGGTLTGQLNGTSAAFSGSCNAGNSTIGGIVLSGGGVSGSAATFSGACNAGNSTIGGVTLAGSAINAPQNSSINGVQFAGNGIYVPGTSYLNYTTGAQITTTGGVGGYPYYDNGTSWGVPGNAWYQVASYNFPNPSDRRLKQDMQPAPQDALSRVSRIGIYTFKYISDPQGRERMGFDASEVREHHPHGYFEGEDEAKTQATNLPDMIALLWQAVQELAAQVAAQGLKP